ncbi:hypothetical protein NG819_15130 [Pseudarthrobacter sp. Fe7]|nr:hypothetical protein NG819_15130 [Pseudarthrobacter sp. Fe7]
MNSYEIWATSPMSQIDKAEGLYAWRLILDVWQRMDRLNLNEKGCRLVDKVLQEDLGDCVRKSAYTLSASNSPSVPYLWKNYAGWDGFAIGLDTDYFWAPKYRLQQILALDKFDRRLPAAEGWRQILYNRDEQIACVERALKWVANNWWRVGEVSGIYLPWADFIDSARFIVQSLLLLMKEESFSQESEVRFIAGTPPETPVTLTHGGKSYLPLAVIPKLINDRTQPGLPVANLVYGSQTEANQVTSLAERIGIPPERVWEVELDE